MTSFATVDALAREMEACSRLEEVYLSDNHVADDGAVVLGAAAETKWRKPHLLALDRASSPT